MFGGSGDLEEKASGKRWPEEISHKEDHSREKEQQMQRAWGRDSQRVWREVVKRRVEGNMAGNR